MKVGIAGVGGIGSNVARILAQAKVKQIKIVDYDVVEAENLNRQFYRLSQQGLKKTECLQKNLLDIFADLEIEAIQKQIMPGDLVGLFSDCAVVVEGFDDKTIKKMLVEELAEKDMIMVSASGIAGPEMDTVRVRQMGNCYIVGDFVSDQDEHALFPPKVAMISSIMAGIVLRKLDGLSRDNKEDGADE